MTCKDSFLLSRNSFGFNNVKIVAARLIVFHLLSTHLCTLGRVNYGGKSVCLIITSSLYMI